MFRQHHQISKQARPRSCSTACMLRPSLLGPLFLGACLLGARLLRMVLTASLTLLPLAAQGQPASRPSSQAIIGFDLTLLDDDGLIGPVTGKRAVDYEYCIPDNADSQAEVAAIDPTARIMTGSRGRIGCLPGQSLVMGNTHQADFRGVLRRLAGLAYVQRIEQAYFE